MSVSKGYNRIVFLTTLSVYLGLVLVGGTAPVLAHSALTKHFDVRNEIEFKDDLDNKPDNEEIEIASDDLPVLFTQLLSEIKADISERKLSFPIPKDFSLSVARTINMYGGGSGTGPFCGDGNLFNRTLENAINKFQYIGWELSDYVDSSKSSKSILQSIDGNWTLKVSFSKENPSEFSEFLNRQFLASANLAKSNLLKQVYKNTNSSFENSQVFIVTYLPRASIDEFLAENNAQ